MKIIQRKNKKNTFYFGNKKESYYLNESDYGKKDISYSFDALSKSEKNFSKTMRGIFEGKLTKKDGKVVYKSDTTKIKYKNFVEIGPGKVLSGLIKRINKDVNVKSINNEEDIKLLLND